MMETPPNSTPSDTAALPVGPHQQRKPRTVLSCITCRNRKLRCDKGRPCHNCSKRHQPCRYYNSPMSGSTVPSASGKHVRSTRDLDRRLQHLEELLVLLNDQQHVKRRKSSSEPANDPETYEPASEEEEDCDLDLDSDASSKDKARAPQIREPTMAQATGGKVEANSGKWQAVLDDITELRSFLLREGPVNVMQCDLGDNGSLQSPVLLLNTTPRPTKADLLASIPPKGVVDQMISEVLSSGEPAVVILHVPTFMNEYNEFWIDPASVPFSWLGKLFGLLCLAALFQRREGDALLTPLEDIEDTVDYLRLRTAQCLIVADYTRPGLHKIEALIVYMASEYFRSKDAQLGVSMIIGIIVRLAMSMGYHRDPDRDPSISVFEGEMIRRSWTFLTQVERLTSFQMGLPTIIYRAQSDTRPPHNILDSDIDPSTTSMPPERPDREQTPISFIVAKERVVKAFALIMDSLNASKPIPYKGVMQLDANLQKVRSLLPPPFRIQPPSQSYLEPADLIMKRYTFDFLLLKGRCVLHRQYLSHETTNPKRSSSRSICLDAARQILRHQADIHRQIQPSGILATKSWFIMSLTSSDFLLAAMILSLCVSQRRQLLNDGHDVAALGFPPSEETETSLLQELVTSQRIWMSLSQRPAGFSRPAEAVALMLAQAQLAVRGNESRRPVCGAQGPLLTAMGNTLTSGIEQSINSVTDANAAFDWETWDRYFQVGPTDANFVGYHSTAAAAAPAFSSQTVPQDVPPLDAFSNLTFDGSIPVSEAPGFDVNTDPAMAHENTMAFSLSSDYGT